jgi:S-adenosylmethionine hydrolase
VTLLTDFGSRDPFAGVMKGVILRGAPLDELGGVVEDHVRIELPRPERVTDDADALELVGEVVHVDRFGNLVTNLREEDITREGAPGRGDAPVEFEAEGARVRIELSVREGSAARGIGAAVGTRVRVRVER